MQSTVSQAPMGVKVEGVAWAWGFEAGVKGQSLYDGYQFWCGARFLQWERGWNAGTALRKRIEEKVIALVRSELHGAPADLIAGVAAVEMGESYCPKGIDWAAVEDERIGD